VLDMAISLPWEVGPVSVPGLSVRQVAVRRVIPPG
jgi:hypothetical protein